MKNVSIETLFELKFPTSLALSESGAELAFTMAVPDEVENTYHRDIYSLREGQVRQLTNSGTVGSFAFFNDRCLLFMDEREKEKKEKEKAPQSYFYYLPLDGGEANLAYKLPLDVNHFELTANGKILFSAGVELEAQDLHLLPAEEREAFYQKRDEKKWRTNLSQIPFWGNGRGITEGKISSLFIFDPNLGTITRLTPQGLDVSSYRLSEDKERVYIVAQTFNKRASLTEGLYFINLAQLQEGERDASVLCRMLLPEDQLSITTVWEVEPELKGASKIYFLANDMSRYGMNQSDFLYEYVPEEQGYRALSEEEIIMWDSVGSDVCFDASPSTQVINGEFYYLTTKRFRTALRCVRRDGRIEELYEADGRVTAMVPDQGAFLMIALLGQRAPEIYRLFEGEPILQSRINMDVLAEYQVAEPIYLPDEVEDGIDGWILLPADYSADQSYPAILDIHGGPRTVYGEVFFHEMQYWVAQGYIVIFCNPRGSDGRGDAFADIRGHYGDTDYEDIMAFVDRCLERFPSIDKNRIGVTGGSYGGFMCNWILGHSERFAACATQRSISNWLSFYGVSDIGYTFAGDQNNCDSFSQSGMMKMWEHSPLRYINSAVTPTLILHSDEDYRCPLEQGIQLFTALQDRGIESEMVIFHGENHELSRSGKPKARRERLERITSWMDRFLKEE